MAMEVNAVTRRRFGVKMYIQATAGSAHVPNAEFVRLPRKDER